MRLNLPSLIVFYFSPFIYSTTYTDGRLFVLALNFQIWGRFPLNWKIGKLSTKSSPSFLNIPCFSYNVDTPKVPKTGLGREKLHALPLFTFRLGCFAEDREKMALFCYHFQWLSQSVMFYYGTKINKDFPRLPWATCLMKKSAPQALSTEWQVL